jgi:eukaryotic-like serine/threonine-protein kinase
MSDPALRVDDILQGYANPRPLSSGGQKQVFVVDHAEAGTAVLKIGHYHSDSILDRICREVEILRSLDHPGFPRQYSFAVVEGQRFVILEEFIPGTPLSNRMRDFPRPSEAFGFLAQLLEPLALLWGRRVIHRDLKPANIIVTEDGPRIIDLGIARVLDASSLTLSLAPFGPCTPDYASPEQLQNRKRDIDHRTDQFCLGIVTGQLLLEGLHPYESGNGAGGNSIPENILAGRWGRTALRERLSSSQFSVVEKMLGSQPYMRYRTPDVLVSAVERAGNE